MSARLVCDFCADPNPVCRFEISAGGQASAVISDARGMAVVTHFDDGHWAACDTCRDWIIQVKPGADLKTVEDAMMGVARRSYGTMMRHHPDVPSALAAISIADMHAIFWQRYDGSEPTPL